MTLPFFKLYTMILLANGKPYEQVISEKLMKVLKAARPQRGKKQTFQKLGVKLQSFEKDGMDMGKRWVGGTAQVLTTCIIKDGDNRLNLQLIDSVQPNPQDTAKDKIIPAKNIQFTAHRNAGKWDFYDKDEHTMPIFDYLFLAPFNRANVDEDWFVAHPNGFVYELLKPVDTAQKSIQKDLSLAEALQAIEGWNDKTTMLVAKGIGIKDLKGKLMGIENLENIDVIKSELMSFAKEEPGIILGADRDRQVRALALVKDLVENKVVKVHRNSWMYYDSGHMFLTIPVGKKQYDFLAEFLLKDENKEVKDQFVKLLEDKTVQEVS